MSKIGNDLLSAEWKDRQIEKMMYIHKEMKFLIKIGKLNNMIKRIYKKYTAEIFRRSTVPLCKGDLALDHFMKPLNVDTALEIGTWNGIPAAYMTQYAKKVITIDVIDNPIKYQVWSHLGILDKIEFYLVKNEIEKERLLRDLEFDFCYMDGNHLSYTYSDWMMVRKCGRVLFHEYWDKQLPVLSLINSLPKVEVKTLRVANEYGKIKDYHFAMWTRKITKDLK